LVPDSNAVICFCVEANVVINCCIETYFFNMYVIAGYDETLFSVVVQHNGFFCGLHENLCYIQASVEHWDDCSTDTWSIHWIDELLGQMGYERDGRMHVYWCPPGKEVTDGLVCIEKDADIVAMCVVSDMRSLLFS
jgi:hypothetical protein